MPQPARPHIAAALQHLRSGVTLCGSVLCLALAAQVIVWACVHFMDLRTKRLGPETGAAPLTVVTRSPGEDALEKTAPVPRAGPVGASSARSLIPGSNQARSSSVPAEAPEAGPVAAPADVNLVRAPGDLVLSRVAAIVQAAGIIASVTLALVLVLGVLIASGAQAPGVQYCVTAAFWGIVIACLGVPMTGLVPGSAFPGVFASYGVMAQAADLYRLDSPTALPGPGYYGLFCLLPMAVAVGVAACVLRFRAGVEEGVLINFVSQIDEKIEREISAHRDKWSMMGGRAVGALNRAMGDPIARTPGSGAAGAPMAGPGTIGPITRKAAGAERMGPSDDDTPMATPRRPI